jgi:hypothetical protein
MKVRNLPVPIWKRKQHQEKHVLVKGSKVKKDDLNSVGTAVSQEFCHKILWNQYPKNLIDVVKEKAGAAPPPIPLGPSDFEEDGRMKYETIKRCIERVYPGAQANPSLRKALLGVLSDEGLNHSNTYFGCSKSPLDVCTIFRGDWMFPDDYVNIGGLGGLPFGGRIGFRTLLKRVPESCCLFLLLATHTGFDPAGNLGFAQRLDTKTMQVSPPLQTCRAGMKAFKILLENPEYSLSKIEQQDRQYNYIFNLVKHHFDHISECDFVTEGIGRVFLEKTRDTILKYLGESKKAQNMIVVLLTGTQIETPSGMDDYFNVTDLEIRRGARLEDLKSYKDKLKYFFDREHLSKH